MRKYILILTTVFIASCVTTLKYTVGVNSFGDLNSIKSKSYSIVPANNEVKPEDFEFLEYSKYIERALLRKALSKQADPQKADMIIFLSYGIGEPETHVREYSVPILGTTGVSSTNTSGNIYKFGNISMYSQNSVNTPQYGVVGYQNRREESTTFTRYISLSGYDLNAYRLNGKEKQLFETRIVSVGLSNDLRKVFPIMVAAALDYIGTDTKEVKLVDISDQLKDDRVLYVKGIKYIASNVKRIYHNPKCEYVYLISDENRIIISDSEDPVSLGYKPCLYCKP